MEEKGLPVDKVWSELKAKLAEDLTYESGLILGSMCTKPHSLARRVYTYSLDKNLGDPGLFKGSVAIEGEVVRMLGRLLSNPEAFGAIVSGGSEANLLALWAARNHSKGSEVIAPASAHISIDKAANLLGLKLIKAPLTASFQVNVQKVKRAVSNRTAALIGIAGTTSLGVVDPIEELSEIALEEHLWLHVDAAFGGLVLPFLAELGYKAPSFDFRLKGVKSITVDPHKMGLTPIPAGGILFRGKDLVKPITFNVPYLSGGNAYQFTVTGTRPAAPVIAAWAIFKALGREGFRKIVARCMKLTNLLADNLSTIPRVKLVVKPVMNVVGISFQGVEASRVAAALRSRGWALSAASNYIRIVVMPHVKRRHVEAFLKDLKEVLLKLV
ncbi:MAG: tyrosine decarboxylase MfnA [Candidatus Nezhaarchaeales archaeon]